MTTEGEMVTVLTVAEKSLLHPLGKSSNPAAQSVKVLRHGEAEIKVQLVTTVAFPTGVFHMNSL